MYYSSDDVMNTYVWGWAEDHAKLAAAQVLIWMPLYRPLGEVIYLAFFSAFGFDPLPLHLFGWLLLIGNVVAGYWMLRAVLGSAVAALLGSSVILVHGALDELYVSTGTLFDRLLFLFTALAVGFYAKLRNSSERIGVRDVGILWVLCVLAMNSKESGVLVPVLLGLYECCFVLPRTRFRTWLQSITPMYLLLGATCAAFYFGRVARTEALQQTAGYHVNASFATWWQHMSHYVALLSYREADSGILLAAVLGGSLALAIGLRNTTMLYGWMWFVLTLTPVALISIRPGYVLYVPLLGAGVYFGEFLSRSRITLAMSAAGLVLVWNAVHWPGFPDPQKTAMYGLAEQFQREYPSMKPGSRLLFLGDYFAPHDWAMTFALRLLYEDRELQVRRQGANPEQQPQPGETSFDHVFAPVGIRFEELDGTDLERSVKLHIVKNQKLGREVVLSAPGHGAFVVTGVQDFEGSDEGRWTTQKATLKFEVPPKDGEFQFVYYAPDFVVDSAERTLSVSVNGAKIGSTRLQKGGNQIVQFPVSAAQISTSGFTLVDFEVDRPYLDQYGVKLGIVLLKAGFSEAQ